MSKRLVLFAVVSSIVGGYIGSARAAYLQLNDQYTFKQTNPPDQQTNPSDGTSPNPPTTCVPAASASASSDVALDHQSGSVSAAGAASLSGACDTLNAAGLGSAAATFTIAAGPGESPGQLLAFCYHANINQSAASDPFTVQSVIDPASIVLNGSEDIFTFGPSTLTGHQPSVVLQRSQTFTAAIGDQLTLSIGASGSVTATGVGSGNASASGALDVTVGACDPTSVPALSPVGVSALALVLCCLGLGLSWRNLGARSAR